VLLLLLPVPLMALADIGCGCPQAVLNFPDGPPPGLVEGRKEKKRRPKAKAITSKYNGACGGCLRSGQNLLDKSRFMSLNGLASREAWRGLRRGVG
jgi:hypothetical protein